MQDERLVVGFDSSDDAAVYLVRDDLAAIHTVDFFPPIVDDPYAFGQIAAANSLSDVYAMGGMPNLAMNLICFPSCLDLQTVRAILEGGADKVREAGAVIAGGHSIEDSEPKYGLCVTGYAHPDDILRNDRARPGDKLVLTKPLGTGILTTAAMAELLDEQQVRDMTAVMATLNKNAQRAMMPVRPSACTDVTGFGFLGHLCELARGSGLSVVVDSKSVPVLPGVLDLAAEGIIPAGAYRNMDFVADEVAVDPSVPQELSDVLFDPQTSGGLLISVPESRAGELMRRLEAENIAAAVVAEVRGQGEKAVTVL